MYKRKLADDTSYFLLFIYFILLVAQLVLRTDTIFLMSTSSGGQRYDKKKGKQNYHYSFPSVLGPNTNTENQNQYIT